MYVVANSRDLEQGKALSTNGPAPWEAQLPGLTMGTRYSRAPIAEAILEFRVSRRPDITLDDLRSAADETELSVIRPSVNFEGEFSLTETDWASAASGEQIGFTFLRPDGLRAVQADLDRFAFSWRTGYTDWTEFISAAEEAWGRYRDVARPLAVELVGVRFVNHIEMPRTSVEIKDYLRTNVDISPYLPQGISSLYMQVDVPLTNTGLIATVTSAMLTRPAEDGPKVALLLDIDVKARGLILPLDSPNLDESVTETLDSLRMAKNFVFEACITDATRGLIK